MKYRLTLSIYTLLAPMFALIERMTEAIVGAGLHAYDRLTYGFVNVLDLLAPMPPDAAMAGGLRLSPGREVRYLSQGIHMRAQPRSLLGDPNDPEDEDDDEDALDNGLRHSTRC